MILLIALVMWITLGAVGTICWWITQFDFTTTDIPMVLLGGIAGPLLPIILWLTTITSGKILILKARY